MRLLKNLLGRLSIALRKYEQVAPQEAAPDVAFAHDPIPQPSPELFTTVQEPGTSEADERKREMEQQQREERAQEVPEWRRQMDCTMSTIADKLQASSRFDALCKGLKEIITAPPEYGDWDAWYDWARKQAASEVDEEGVSCELLNTTDPTPILITGELCHLRKAVNRIKEFCVEAGHPDKAVELDPVLELIDRWRKEVKEKKWHEVDAIGLRMKEVMKAGFGRCQDAPITDYLGFLRQSSARNP